MLKTVATFALGKGISLRVARGSVLDFAAPPPSATSGGNAVVVGAIVNAANEGCLGGGGVDGAISDAGGPDLARDREALPILQGTRDVRCETGNAKITGPGDYGTLHVPYVIHAVGPAYFRYEGVVVEGREDDPFAYPDGLLFSAYQQSLQRCQEKDITDVGYSLLSSGIFRGRQSMPAVLGIGIEAIHEWVTESTDVGKLKSVTLCGFSEREAALLLKVTTRVLGKDAMEKVPQQREKEDDQTDNEEDLGETKTTMQGVKVVSEVATSEDASSTQDGTSTDDGIHAMEKVESVISKKMKIDSVQDPPAEPTQQETGIEPSTSIEQEAAVEDKDWVKIDKDAGKDSEEEL